LTSISSIRIHQSLVREGGRKEGRKRGRKKGKMEEEQEEEEVVVVVVVVVVAVMVVEEEEENRTCGEFDVEEEGGEDLARMMCSKLLIQNAHLEVKIITNQSNEEAGEKKAYQLWEVHGAAVDVNVL